MERHIQDERVWLWDFDFLANPKAVKEWSKGTPEDWATESLQVAKEAYCLPGTKTVMKSGTKLGDGYCRFALPIIQKQLAKAKAPSEMETLMMSAQGLGQQKLDGCDHQSNGICMYWDWVYSIRNSRRYG